MNSRQLITIALVCSLALSGCAGWGADGPAEDDEQNDSNTSDLENASNESETENETNTTTSNASESEDESDAASSDSASSSSTESTQSESESDDSDSSDSTTEQSADEGTADSTTDSSDSNPQGSDGEDTPAQSDESDDAEESDTAETDTDSDSDSESNTDSETDTAPDESETNGDEGDENETDSEPEPDPEANTTLTVTVVDSETGDPLDGTVQILPLGWGIVYEKETTNGEVTFSTEEDGLPTETESGSATTEVDYEADVEGYQIDEETTDFTSTIELGADNSHTLELVERAELHPLTLTVTVLNQNGEPVEGETVEWGPGPESIDESATTDENGEVEITVESSDPTDVVQMVVEVDGEQQTGSLHSEGGTLEFTVHQETGVLAPNETDESAARA